MEEKFIEFKTAKIAKDIFIILSELLDKKPDSNREIESVTIGKGIFTKDQIKEIAKYYLNK